MADAPEVVAQTEPAEPAAPAEPEAAGAVPQAEDLPLPASPLSSGAELNPNPPPAAEPALPSAESTEQTGSYASVAATPATTAKEKENVKVTKPAKSGGSGGGGGGSWGGWGGWGGRDWARQRALQDTKQYRDGYPGKPNDRRMGDNLRFYSNELRSQPDGDLIDNIHTKWWGNYGLLEQHHGYIQWLFPIREPGLNWSAQELQPHEAEAIRADPARMARVRKSYDLMLDFYGMRRVNDRGELERSENWQGRYRNLNSSSHNYLRITRILKFLGEVDLEHWKLPFVLFVLREIYENRQLTNARESCENYWAGVLRSDEQRAEVDRWIAEHQR